MWFAQIRFPLIFFVNNGKPVRFILQTKNFSVQIRVDQNFSLIVFFASYQKFHYLINNQFTQKLRRRGSIVTIFEYIQKKEVSSGN